MALRVSDNEVREIKPSDSISDYTPFIETANVLVSEINSRFGKNFSEARLTQIEKWLAAHYASAQDPMVARERFEQAEKTYQIGNRQMYGIMSDTYGQTANTLSEGCLLEFEKRKFTISSIGATYD